MILDVPQVAAFLNLPAKTIRKLAAGRVIPAVKLGKSWRFDETTLREWKSDPEGFHRRILRDRRNKERIVELRPLRAAYYSKYRASKACRSPKWADHNAILVLYRTARRVSDCLGIPFHVDHIVPLHGRNVCGLHVENNLRLLPKRTNQSKGRRWTPA